MQIDLDSNEIIIKPGELYLAHDTQLNVESLVNRFIQPGEQLFPNIIAQQLGFVESLEINGVTYFYFDRFKLLEFLKIKASVLTTNSSQVLVSVV